MDPEADIWNKRQMSEPDAVTCTRIGFHGYKRESHTQTTTKGFKPFHKILVGKRDKFYPYVIKIWGSHSHKVQVYAGTRNEYA
jgi:hypothetical protein